jgi:diguanylate cyclase
MCRYADVAMLTRAQPFKEVHGASPADAVVDALGAILGALGDHALALPDMTQEQIRQAFDAWRRHLLVGAPHPTTPQFVGRDVVGARRFALQYREDEMQFHGKAGSALRDALWQLVSQVGEALASGDNEDARAEQQLAALKSALSKGSVDELRQAARNTVDVISSSLADRRSRNESQLQSLRTHVASMRTELEQTRSALQIDALTKLYNRGAFDAHVVRISQLASLVAEPTALMLVDIDHFKKVNDTHGHQSGDLVLRQVADACIRTFPRQRDFVARYGGEELVVIAHDLDAGHLPTVAKRLLQAVRDIPAASLTGEPINVTVSIGAAILEDDDEPRTWIDRADKAMYRAKNAGRDRAIIVAAGRDKVIA